MVNRPLCYRHRQSGAVVWEISDKMMKRHLKAAHGMTPDEYRQRWGLPGDYPIIAPNYAAMRSKLAKKIGLGRKPGTKVKARRKA